MRVWEQGYWLAVLEQPDDSHATYTVPNALSGKIFKSINPL